MAAPAVEQAQLGVFIVAGAGIGAAIGMWPAGIARSRGRTGMAVVSVVACVLAGALGGCLFAAPLAWVLSLIAKGLPVAGEWDADSGIAYEDYQREMRRGGGGSRRRADDARGPRTPDQPYTAIGHVLVCNGCRQSTSKGPGGVVPSECPTCGLFFTSRKGSEPPRPRSRPKTARPAGEDLVELRAADGRGRR